MSNFPQDVYARNLLSHRGYPLWTPEPSIELPDSYQREGLKIGDVGVVVPEDGSFDVFFNITLPREHPLHAADGVPDNFAQVKLRREDYRIVPVAECPGRVISSSSVECTVNSVDPFDLNGKARSLTDHQFSLCRNEGAMLILPEGAERHRLAKHLLLLDVVIKNAVDWYRFAREQLFRDISNEAIYLITGFHKATSWSLASFENTGASFARCKLVQLTNGGPILTSHSTWETVRPLEWRIGPQHSTGIPNQSVFITGFKIAVNKELLHLKRITVKVDHSRRTLASKLVGFGASLANILVETSGETHSSTTATQDEASDQRTTEGVHTDRHEDVTVERVPYALEPFHPSDFINRYLFKKEPSAKIAVTHDSQWIDLLEKGILQVEELLREERLEAVISREFNIVSKDGVVYLQDIVPETSSPTDMDVTDEAGFSQQDLELNSQTSHDYVPDSGHVQSRLVPSINIQHAEDASALFDGGVFSSDMYDLHSFVPENTNSDTCSHGLQSEYLPSNSFPNRSSELDTISELSHLTTTNQLYLNHDPSVPYSTILQELQEDSTAPADGLSPSSLDSPIPSPTSSFASSLSSSSYEPMALSDSESLVSPSLTTSNQRSLLQLQALNSRSDTPPAFIELFPDDCIPPSGPSGYSVHRRSESSSSARREPVASKAISEANSRRRRHPAQFECSECKQTFTALFSLKRHQITHTGERPFVCSIPGCKQRFYNSSDCKRHEKSKKRHSNLELASTVTQKSSTKTNAVEERIAALHQQTDSGTDRFPTIGYHRPTSQKYDTDMQVVHSPGIPDHQS